MAKKRVRERMEWVAVAKATAGLMVLALLPGIAWGATAVDDSYTTPRDTQLFIGSPGLLANDPCECWVAAVNGTSFEGEIGLELASGAVITVGSEGFLRYEPNGTEVSQDSFTYHAQDESGASQATVTITLTAAEPSSPTANDDEYTVMAGSFLDVPAPGILGNDTHPSFGTLTVGLVNGSAVEFPYQETLSHGVLTVYQDGRITYQHTGEVSDGDVVPDSFSYSATDGVSNSAPATVTITATEPPTSDSGLSVRIPDVGSVEIGSEIGRDGVDDVSVMASPGSSGFASGAGLPVTTPGVVLRISDRQLRAEAREILRSCERLALVAQARPDKYDFQAEIFTLDPAGVASLGPDGEVVVEIASTRTRCWLHRVGGGGDGGTGEGGDR
jgi:hypothetical protein